MANEALLDRMTPRNLPKGLAMSALPQRKYITEEEYLILEERAETKSEYFDGEIFAMAGATGNHVKIAGNLFLQIANLLDGKKCHPFINDIKVKVEATGLISYPDVIVICGKEEYLDDKERILLNPTLLGEVLSESTEDYDRTTKLRHYKKIPTLREFILVSQDMAFIEIHTKQRNGSWKLSSVEGLVESLPLKSLGITIPMAQIYSRTRLEE